MKYFAFLHKHLSRITSSGEFISEVDGLRFVAVMSVILFHICTYLVSHLDMFSHQDLSTNLLQEVFYRGDFGVMLFFVLSGFILSLPFARQFLQEGEPVKLKRYYLRRLTRIEPPYAIAILLSYVLIIAVKHESPSALFPHLIASLTYLHNIVYGAPSTICVVAWSLEVEVQFYLLAPLLTRAFYSQANPMIRRAIICFAIVVAAFASYWLNQPVTLLTCLQYFLIGFLLSDLYATDALNIAKKTALHDLLGAIAWLAIVAVAHQTRWTDLISPWLVLTAYVCAFKGKFSNKLFRNPWLVIIGGMCYTIYLYHLLIISALGRFSTLWIFGDSFSLNLIVQTMLLVPGILISSAVLFVLTERPFMRRGVAVNPGNNR